MSKTTRRWMNYVRVFAMAVLIAIWAFNLKAYAETPSSNGKQEERVIYVDAPPVETLPASEETKVQEDTIMVHEDGTVEYIINVDAPVPTEPETEPESEPEPEETYEYLGVFKLTAYCTGSCCNSEKNAGKSALGTPLKPYYTVAVDRRVIPLGTPLEINIPGEGWTSFLAEDVGWGVEGKRIDVCVPEHWMCTSSQCEKYNGRCEVRIVHAAK